MKQVKIKKLFECLILALLLNSTSAVSDVATDFIMASKEIAAGRYQKANYFYFRILSVDPNNIEAQYGLAQCFNKTRQTKLALTELKKILLINPDHVKSLTLRATIFTQQHNWDAVMIDAEHLVQINPLNKQAYMFMDNAFSVQGDTESAKAAIERYEQVKALAQ